jgi:signal transduction histidine kinase
MKGAEPPTEIDFYGAVVCELRQPLTAITGGIQLAMRFLETDPARATQALDEVAIQLTRIDRLLVELRDRARDAAHAEVLFKR